MAGEHTPGPWRVACREGDNDFSTDDVMTCGTPSRRIANVYGGQSTPESAANAQLIARAPQMAAENAALRAEVERLREWEVFAAHEIATLKSSAGYLRDEIERRWQRAFERVGRALDAHEMAMERAKHDYDASRAGSALYDMVRTAYDDATLPAPPMKEEE